MNYSIKDLAELIGCTTSAIRYFEKENLIRVEKNTSGHRSYDIVDVFRLLSYEKYRSMEIPMKTIIEQFSGRENDRVSIQKREERYKEEALGKAQYYKDLADSIEDHLIGIRRIDTLLNQYELAQSPDVFVICDEECGWLSKNRNSQRLLHEWVSAMPQVQLAVLHSDLNLSDFGYFIRTEKKDKLKLPVGLKTKRLKSVSCIHTIVAVDGSSMEHPQEIFQETIAYAKQKNMEIGSMNFGKILLVEVGEMEQLKIYIELWVAVHI